MTAPFFETVSHVVGGPESSDFEMHQFFSKEFFSNCDILYRCFRTERLTPDKFTLKHQVGFILHDIPMFVLF